MVRTDFMTDFPYFSFYRNDNVLEIGVPYDVVAGFSHPNGEIASSKWLKPPDLG
jgi:hypothetical protein